MNSEVKYNTKSPAVKRLMREACELKDPTEEYWARPLEDNLFEWHFTVQGPPETDFNGGIYHGRILLPTEYPMKPPNIILLTPNGRFEINKKICLSISGHHPETWQPSWSIRTALLALIAFMPMSGTGTIGALDYTPEERIVLARKSRTWECTNCGKIAHHLSKSPSKPATQEEVALIRQIALKGEESSSEKKSKGENLLDDSSAQDEHLGAASHQRSTDTEARVDDVPLNQAVPVTAGDMSSRLESYKNILICFLVAAISMLVYRRLFLI
uniref:UBC core domain-containing protein n=2 Tax=Timema TaxID=61471 RepID=A0A7R9IEW3_9NEOP|nr:unnamed protein product [Timema bartmani]CAD7456947.1 unnamed protein product [Timema tahoe]